MVLREHPKVNLTLFRLCNANSNFILEFKEIRKEWKARKKEEEAQRKAQEEAERARQGEQAEQQPHVPAVTAATYTAIPARQLPAIGGYAQQPQVHYGAAPATTGLEQLYSTTNTPSIYSSAGYSYPVASSYAAPRPAQPQTVAEDDADGQADNDVNHSNSTNYTS